MICVVVESIDQLLRDVHQFIYIFNYLERSQEHCYFALPL